MEIQQINDIKRGAFEAVEDGKEAGKMTYTWAGDSKFIIDHTEVNEEFNEKGVGKKLLMATVD
jgi:predicted GNAT family acetyltransferase